MANYSFKSRSLLSLSEGSGHSFDFEDGLLDPVLLLLHEVSVARLRLLVIQKLVDLLPLEAGALDRFSLFAPGPGVVLVLEDAHKHAHLPVLFEQARPPFWLGGALALVAGLGARVERLLCRREDLAVQGVLALDFTKRAAGQRVRAQLLIAFQSIGRELLSVEVGGLYWTFSIDN